MNCVTSLEQCPEQHSVIIHMNIHIERGWMEDCNSFCQFRPDFQTNFMSELVYIDEKSCLNLGISNKGLWACIYYTSWNMTINKTVYFLMGYRSKLKGTCHKICL